MLLRTLGRDGRNFSKIVPSTNFEFSFLEFLSKKEQMFFLDVPDECIYIMFSSANFLSESFAYVTKNKMKKKIDPKLFSYFCTQKCFEIFVTEIKWFKIISQNWRRKSRKIEKKSAAKLKKKVPHIWKKKSRKKRRKK